MTAESIVGRKTATKSRVRPISIGKPLSRGLTDFRRRFILVRELRNGIIVREKKTGKLLKVYGDKIGRTVIEPYAP